MKVNDEKIKGKKFTFLRILDVHVHHSYVGQLLDVGLRPVPLVCQALRPHTCALGAQCLLPFTLPFLTSRLRSA